MPGDGIDYHAHRAVAAGGNDQVARFGHILQYIFGCGIDCGAAYIDPVSGFAKAIDYRAEPELGGGSRTRFGVVNQTRSLFQFSDLCFCNI
ncbi:MAG: hypothetical protein BWY75_03276 [bacterium ADurb.Bin425]|nr:MAG: hypothetical protein BWY75_03276 [bacterium ADurb.Bin425]